jgi:eukaryotic-like serine/threonine-protein kinase
MPLSPGTRLGPYEIAALIGRGGMGEVYRGIDTRIDRTVAIKVLPAEARQRDERRVRFEREARAVGRLNHPHICALYDVGSQGAVEFLIMEYLDGETLADRLRRGPVPLAEALPIAVGLAQAIACAHDAGVLHRDLKPGNVMLTATGPKLLDFGLARWLDPPEEPGVAADRPTADGSGGGIVGTFSYMAPEQIEGRPCDERADIFCLGLVIHEMLAARHPFARPGEGGVIAGILTGNPTPLRAECPEAPLALERLIGNCLARRPDDRWQHAGDLARELTAVGQGETSTSTAAVIALADKQRHRRWLAGAGMAAAIAGAIAAAGVVRSTRLSSPQTRSLAVLPCRTIGTDARGQAFCDGLAETLAAKLTPIAVANSVQLTPVTEVTRRKVTTAADARRVVGATLTLEGSVATDGGSLRVNYALVDTATLRQIDAYSATAVADPFSVQDRVVEWAMQVLALTPSEQQRRALSSHGTQMPGAYEYYIQGLGYLLDPQKFSNIESAIELFQRAIALDPKYAASYAGLGRAHWLRYESTLDQGWVQKAREACASAVKLAPHSSAAQLCLGTIQNGTGQYAQAAESFTKALTDEPANEEAFIGLAQAYEHLGDDNRAESTYQRAIATRPQYWAAHARLGGFYRQRGRYRDAVRADAIVAALTPDNPVAYLTLGADDVYAGEYEQALTAFRRCAQLQPSAACSGNIGMTLFRLRRFEESVAAMREAVRLRPDDYRFLASLGRALYWNNRRTEALEIYQRALTLGIKDLRVNPSSVDVRLTLADCAAKLDRRSEALSYLESIDHAERNPHNLFFVAIVHNQLQDSDDALKHLELARTYGLPVSELNAWVELDNLRGDPRFKALTAGPKPHS